MLPITRTMLHNISQHSQLWTCFHWRGGVQGRGFSSGGGRSRVLIWRVYWSKHVCQRRKGDEGYGRERIHREIQNTKARDNVAVNYLGTYNNTPQAYTLGLEHHRLNMSKLGRNWCQLQRERKTQTMDDRNIVFNVCMECVTNIRNRKYSILCIN